MWQRQEQDRCDYLDCDQPAQFYKLVAGSGGLNPDDCQVGGFCSEEHADRIPAPTPEAKARAKAKLDARAQAKRRK